MPTRQGLINYLLHSGQGYNEATARAWCEKNIPRWHLLEEK
ncbi:hypothetical protein [Motilimonas cestriensis]|nr:hypothetical protein [Motilimonas cestriensis]